MFSMRVRCDEKSLDRVVKILAHVCMDVDGYLTILPHGREAAVEVFVSGPVATKYCLECRHELKAEDYGKASCPYCGVA